MFSPSRFLRCFCITVITVAAAGMAWAGEPLALQKGEQFTYRLSWGIFGKAGELTITADEEPTSPAERTRITMKTSTRGVIRALYPFDGQADSIYDNASGRLVEATATTITRTKETEAVIQLDYEKAVANYTDVRRPERSVEVAMPEMEPVDFLTTLIQTRQWDIDVGQQRDVSVLFDDEFYELTIFAEAVETIKTPWGRKETLKLVPRMEENPKGMFKRGGEVRVWVSRDEDRLPLRFEVKVGVGTAMAILTDYRDVGAETAAAAKPAPQDK